MDNVTIYKQKFGERLRKLRDEMDMKQEELSEKLNLSTEQISKLENGHAEPRLSTLIQSMEIFDVGIEYLLGLSDNKKSTPEKSIMELQQKSYELILEFREEINKLKEENAELKEEIKNTDNKSHSKPVDEKQSRLIQSFGLAALTNEQIRNFLGIS